jgi:hypothetical protein
MIITNFNAKLTVRKPFELFFLFEGLQTYLSAIATAQKLLSNRFYLKVPAGNLHINMGKKFNMQFNAGRI